MSIITQLSIFDILDTEKNNNSDIGLSSIQSVSPLNSAGSVFTRLEIVEFMLDLIGYTENKVLHQATILEPSFGAGNFLLPIVNRLLNSWKQYGGRIERAAQDLQSAIYAVEINTQNYANTVEAVKARLKKENFSDSLCNHLIRHWLFCGDFLLRRIDKKFDFIVGNPPYVRQEMIPGALLSEYRNRYKTMTDRADLYIPFIEHSLFLLSHNALLCFICSDRWVKNRYGASLRQYIAQGYHLECYIDMSNVDAFDSHVSAYAGISLISNRSYQPLQRPPTKIVRNPILNTLKQLIPDLTVNPPPLHPSIRVVRDVVHNKEPWIFDWTGQLSIIRKIEQMYPSLEESGCKVGIGVATGADKIFIAKFDRLDIEDDRKLPLITTRDIKSGNLVWQGLGVINPFNKDGSLVRLSDYPKLEKYFRHHQDIIKKRHCAQKSPQNWYRTIDRIWPELCHTPKLLIPDINLSQVVLEHGQYYPHHNLYFITSHSWDLQALQAVLLSDITKLFMTAYSTKISGGYLRFQAQYIRRLHIPFWHNVPDTLRVELANAAKKHCIPSCNAAVSKLFSLNRDERKCLLEEIR